MYRQLPRDRYTFKSYQMGKILFLLLIFSFLRQSPQSLFYQSLLLYICYICYTEIFGGYISDFLISLSV